jgi:uncharacterized protein (AIM24 family)
MFCTSCGVSLEDSVNFCGSCGAHVEHSAAPAPAPPPVQAPVSSGPRTTCPWCAATVGAQQLSCPRCGATLNAAVEVSETGWKQLPGRKDMAKLQFGDSFCQIEGLYVPVADVNLAAADSIYFTHHVLLWKDPQVNISAMPLSGAWKRMFAGLPLVMMQAQGPGHIAFSRDAPGEMIALPLQPGDTIDVREHLFMLATGNVAYDWFMTNVWYTTKSGDDKETHYPVGAFMDRFTAPQSPGLLLLHASGNVLVRELAPGESLLVKPTALIFKDPTVEMQLHFEHPRMGFSMWGSWGNRYVWLRLWGPGRVAVQSAFERMEGENAYLTNCSPATQQQW